MRFPLLLLVLAPALPAQQPDSRVQAVVDVEHRTGWGYGRLGLPYRSPNADHTLFGIDSVRMAPDGGRTWHTSLIGFRSTMPGAVGVDALGRLTAHRAAYVERTPDPFEKASWVRMTDATTGYGLAGAVVPPDARFWDLVPTFHPQSPAPGATWVDTLDQSASLGAYHVTRHVVRRSRILRDTTVEGHQAWIVVDTASASVHESLPIEDAGIGVTDTLVRDARGASAGYYLFDAAAPLVLLRRDSTSLTGTATLRDRTGRAWTSPARFVQARTWRGMGLGAWRTLERERQQERMRARGGMVREPPTRIARRLATGDTVLRDSLFRVVQADAESPGNRQRMDDLSWAMRSSDAFAERVAAWRLARGDTTVILERITSAGRAGLSEADARFLVAAGDDPAIFLRHGRLPGEILNAAASLLSRRPPAAIPFLPSSAWLPFTRWAPACQPAACAVLASARGADHHPDVRDLALLAAFVTEPSRHADAVRRAGRGRVTLDLAADLLDGVGASWSSSTKPAFPSAGSDWRTWRRWMQGNDSSEAPVGRLPGFPLPRFEESHMVAIALHRALTGRDVSAELSRAFAAATNDTAQAVLGTILLRMEKLPRAPEQLASDLRSDAPANRALASEAVNTMLLPGALLRRNERPRTIPAADSALHAMLVDTLLSRMMSGRQTWRHIEERMTPAAPRPQPPAGAGARRPPLRLLTETTDAGTLARWRDRIPAIARADFDALEATQSVMVLELDPWYRAGPFVVVGMATSQQTAAPPGAERRRYASGIHFVLLEVDGEWFIVVMNAWVT